MTTSISSEALLNNNWKWKIYGKWKFKNLENKRNKSYIYVFFSLPGRQTDKIFIKKMLIHQMYVQ